MRSLRCALLCVCLLSGGLVPARADQATLDTCLDALDGIDVDLMILGRENDSCAARQGEIGEAEALLSDIRKLREGDCRADRIAGGAYDAARINELRKSLDEDIAWLRSNIESMRGEAGKVCNGGAPAAGKAPAAADNRHRRGANTGKPTSFVLTVCNLDSTSADLAVSHRSAPESPDFWVEGWWSLNPGECAKIGRFLTGWFYYFASSDDGEWSGDLPLCVTDEPFKRMNFAHANVSCDEDDLVNFNEILVESAEFTVNLRP